MMLPGVELARKRRIHYHGGGGQEGIFPPRGACPAGPSPRAELLRSPTSMAEPAVVARRRLEEKLRGFGRSAAAQYSPATFSWRYPVGGEQGGPPRRGAPAGNNAVPATLTKKTPPPPAADAAATGRRPAEAALERVDSAADECAVCLERVRAGEGRQVLNLPCSHRYHWDCVLPWLAAHPHCPCCRAPVPS